MGPKNRVDFANSGHEHHVARLKGGRTRKYALGGNVW